MSDRPPPREAAAPDRCAHGVLLADPCYRCANAIAASLQDYDCPNCDLPAGHEGEHQTIGAASPAEPPAGRRDEAVRSGARAVQEELASCGHEVDGETAETVAFMAVYAAIEAIEAPSQARFRLADVLQAALHDFPTRCSVKSIAFHERLVTELLRRGVRADAALRASSRPEPEARPQGETR
jgi:hypothetical protein